MMLELIKLDNGNLRIQIYANGKTANERRRNRKKNRKELQALFKSEGSPNNALREVLEPFWTNGWIFSTVDRLGALSEAPFLSEEITVGDNGEYEPDTPNSDNPIIYFYQEYQILDPFIQILKYSYVDFARA